jgi:hypothetical protein
MDESRWDLVIISFKVARAFQTLSAKVKNGTNGITQASLISSLRLSDIIDR